jgi:hypothetical protein
LPSLLNEAASGFGVGDLYFQKRHRPRPLSPFLWNGHDQSVSFGFVHSNGMNATKSRASACCFGAGRASIGCPS